MLDNLVHGMYVLPMIVLYALQALGAMGGIASLVAVRLAN